MAPLSIKKQHRVFSKVLISTLQIFLQGAVKILGVDTEIKFVFKFTVIEATLRLKLPVGGLQADLYIKGGFAGSLKDTGLTVKVDIKTDSDKAKVN